ncbi:MAG: hypothetical protein ACRDZ3_02560 [Acidimicrobiia bacterium]
MSKRSAFTVLAASVGLIVGLVLPAAASEAQKKSVKGVDGRAGTVIRYAERGGGRAYNSVTMTATDSDGRGGRCTETWVDYRTRPHQHFNPGMLVNCSGGTRKVSSAVDNDYKGVFGMSVAVCEVPDTSGRITRNRSNCRGAVSAFDLQSGHRYDDFRVSAAQQPSGVRIWRS